MKKLWFECVDCNVWGAAPEGLKINKHFALCPKCKRGMKAFYTSSPEADGLLSKNKVQITEIIDAPKL